jgi:apolipoprotein N-acyltransferase
LRLVQPNISQGPEFAPDRGAEIVGRYLALSDRATSPDHSGIADVTHLFWPESAFPFVLSRDAGALARIAEFLKGGAVLTTGAASLINNTTTERETLYYNSIAVLDRRGLLGEHYDKHHLVPFGEYLPLRSWLDRLGLTQFTSFPGGFIAGKGSGVVHIPGLPDAIAMICYEAIFPDEWGGARAGDRKSAGWMLNLTDDAWFGRTAGPYQHFAQARLRAIEWGLPLIRVANTGISAIVDARGEIVASRPLGTEAVLDGVLPGALPPTPESRWGSVPFGIALLAAAIASLWARLRS